MIRHTQRAIFLTAVLGIVGSTVVRADDWPQWRGPKRDGVWAETGIVEKFADAKLPIQWRAKIGAGYSGPTVAEGRVYVTDKLTEPKQVEQVHCFNEKTGEEVWSHAYDCEYAISYPAGPRASVSIDSGRAYSLGAMGHLFCFDAASGKILWKKDLKAEYAIDMPIWGIAASPLVVGDLIYLQIGGRGACIVALDKVSGEEKWKALNDKASYSAPIMVQQAGKPVLLCWTGENIAGLNPASGEVYWKLPMKPSRMVINVASPIVSENRIFVTSFYDGSLMAKMDDKTLTAEILWHEVGPDEQHTKSLQSIIGTPYFDGKNVYGVDSYGQFRCLDAATGQRIWESQEAVPRARWSTVHIVRNGERMFMFNERGELIIATLSPEGYHEISRAKLIDPTTAQLNQRGGVCWSHPAYANKHVFARNDKELVCADLAK